MIVQKVVRTATPEKNYWYESDKLKYLEAVLKQGYTVVMCNKIRSRDGEEWLEYIVQKEIKEQKE